MNGLRLEAAAGAVAWLAIVALEAVPVKGPFGRLHELVLLAVLVLVPLVLSLVAGCGRAAVASRTERAILVALPFGAGAAAASFVLPAGPRAAVLATPWCGVATLVAVAGLLRLRRRGLIASEEVAIDAGCLFLPVGALWLLASRAGVAPFGFGEPIALLTAAHFHVAGFAAPILAGLMGRVLLGRDPRRRATFAPVAASLVLGMPIVAAGITASPLVEFAGVVILAAGLLGLAGLVLFRVVPGVSGLPARALLVLSALSLVAGMTLAVVYGASELARADWLTLPAMVDTHAWLNALGFVLLGALGLALAGVPDAQRDEAPPLSRLASRGRVGPHFFERSGAVARELSGPPPRGLVDRLAAYRRPGFDPDDVHPDVRAFYEETSAFGLVVRPDWAPGFRLASRLYKRAARRIGQMNLPTAGTLHEDRIESVILPLDDAVDGRDAVRAWVRTYLHSGEAVYVAAYADTERAGETTMNIAFPLPGGNLTSILRIAALPGAGPGARGVVLTTLPGPDGAGDAGVYFANRLLPVRLPLDETIRVWPAGAPEPSVAEGTPARGARPGGAPAPPIRGASDAGKADTPSRGVTVVARHDMWCCGLRFLTLRYEIFRKGDG